MKTRVFKRPKGELPCIRCGGPLTSVKGDLRCAKCGEQALDGSGVVNDADLARLVADELLLEAERAREDIVAFFDLVMEEESSHLSIQAAAHQRVHLRFVMDHRRSVSLIGVEHAKTFDSVVITLFMLGNHPSLRGAFLSAAHAQAAKAVLMVSDYVLSNARLRLVFPGLLPSDRRNEPWTQTAITVRRPPGTRDPSLVALSLDGPVLGRRIDWLVIDDLLTYENTATQEQRRKVHEWVDSTALTRMNWAQPYARVSVNNTAWHPDDFVHRLIKAGWATIRMGATGDVEVMDDREPFNRISGGAEWDSDELRLSRRVPYLRLAAHDPDSEEKVPLFPERFPPERIERERQGHLPMVFQQMFEQVAHDESSAACKREWIEACKKKAREAGVYHLVDRWSGEGVVFCGVDLAIGKGEHHDYTAFFTFVVLPDGRRQILDIDYGHYDGATNIAKMNQKIRDYNVNLVRVENNSGQDFFRQWALDKQIALPVEAHTTTSRKSHVEDGIQGLFLEIFNGAWLIPNDRNGVCDPKVEYFCEACVGFVPDEHTNDVLMACWFAQTGARRWGMGTEPPKDDGGGGVGELLMR